MFQSFVVFFRFSGSRHPRKLKFFTDGKSELKCVASYGNVCGRLDSLVGLISLQTGSVNCRSFYLYIHNLEIKVFWHETKSKNHLGRKKVRQPRDNGNGIRFLNYVCIYMYYGIGSIIIVEQRRRQGKLLVDQGSEGIKWVAIT